MVDAIEASVIEALLGLELGATGHDAANRFSLEGLTLRSENGGALVIEIRRCEAASLRLARGPLVLEVGRVVLQQVAGHVHVEAGSPRLRSLQAAEAELSGLKIHGPLSFSAESKGNSRASHVHSNPRPSSDNDASPAAGAWCLGPLAAADGRIRAEIVDAHLMFDADLTVPIRRGQIDFNNVTVEHVGPDSRMGVSRLGLYVDAANGRTYIYQFSSAPIAGVEFEQRGALVGAWVANRGNLQLQAFAEGLLRQTPRGPGVGFTEQAGLLFDRTALAGDVQLSDGKFTAPGVQGDLVGRADGRNSIRLHSKAVGRGLTAEMASLSVRHAVLNGNDTRLECDEITGAFVLRVSVERPELRFAFDVAKMKISGLRLHRHHFPSV